MGASQPLEVRRSCRRLRFCADAVRSATRTACCLRLCPGLFLQLVQSSLPPHSTPAYDRKLARMIDRKDYYIHPQNRPQNRPQRNSKSNRQGAHAQPELAGARSELTAGRRIRLGIALLPRSLPPPPLGGVQVEMGWPPGTSTAYSWE
eukprot:915785-Prymnesium_polylepis.2